MKKIQLNMNETKKYLVITAIAQGKKQRNDPVSNSISLKDKSIVCY